MRFVDVYLHNIYIFLHYFNLFHGTNLNLVYAFSPSSLYPESSTDEEVSVAGR
jgi:hypothetical protein